MTKLGSRTWLAAVLAMGFLLAGTGWVHAQPVPSLGAAGDFSFFTFRNTSLTKSDVSLGKYTTINGDVAAGPGPASSLSFVSGATVSGTIYKDSGGGTSITNPPSSPVSTSLTTARSDALAASTSFAAMTPTQTFGGISSSTTITGSAGTNVVSIDSIVLSSSSTLTLSGSSTSVFIINVPSVSGVGSTGQVKFTGSSGITLAGGVTADHVLINVQGASSAGSSDVTFGGGDYKGTFLVSGRDVDMTGSSILTGAIIAGGENIKLSGTSILNGLSFRGGTPVPAPTSVILMGVGGIGLIGWMTHARRRRRLTEEIAAACPAEVTPVLQQAPMPSSDGLRNAS